MPEDKKQSGVLGQIIVAVVIALLVGGTAPWWWKEIFPANPPAPRPEPERPRAPVSTEPAPAPRQDSPESLSRTEHSVPGDAIYAFRVAEIQGREMTIEVDYGCNAQHGDKVMVGAWLKGVSSGYKPTFAPSPLRGTARLQISVNEPGASTDIDIFLSEWGKPSEPFARRLFPYQMRFE